MTRDTKKTEPYTDINKHRESLVIRFDDATVNTTFDFAKLPLATKTSRDFAVAFDAIAGGYRPLTRGPFWRSIKRFAHFVRDRRWSTLPPDALHRYALHLNALDLYESTKDGYYNDVRRLLIWLARNRPKSPWSKLDVSPAFFTRKAGSEKPRGNVLGPLVAKRILKACYADIEKAWADFATGQRILAGETRDGDDPRFVNALLLLARNQNGRRPTQLELLSRGDYRANQYGLRKLRRYLEPTAETLLPFYIALCLQGAGNAFAILALQRDCCRADGLDENLVRLVWGKARAASDQGVPFDVRKRYAAPNLVKRLLAMTEKLSQRSDPRFANYLFIHAPTKGAPRGFSAQTIHDKLAVFIKRHGLPNFDPQDLRVTAAAIVETADGDLRKTQALLNHKRISTTLGYVKKSPAVREQNEKFIAHYQGEIVRWANAGASLARTSGKGSIPVPKGGADTIFGFSCKSPFEGIAPGSRKGELCTKFLQCAACPGSLLVVDDPNVAARLLKARDNLRNARHNMSLYAGGIKRFRAVYQPLLKIIERDLLPKMDKSALSRGRLLVDSLPDTPPLE